MTERPEFATLTEDDLVTGEAVALDLPPAGLGPRILSGLIDVVVTILLLLGLALLTLTSVLDTDLALIRAAMILCLVAVFLVFPTTVETLSRGKSLGKWALGLRTVRDDAGPISAQHAFVRALVGFVEIYAFTGVPAFFSALVSSKGKRLGDYAAGTYVISQRSRMRLLPPPQMPLPLAEWATRADVAAMPAGLTVAVRQFLSRAGALAPSSREPLGRELLGEVLRYVAPAPPPGFHQEYVLSAVIAERRRRDSERLAREDALRRRVVGADPLA